MNNGEPTLGGGVVDPGGAQSPVFPTQPAPHSTGDIILNSDSKPSGPNKKILLVIAVIGIVIIVVIALLLINFSSSRNSSTPAANTNPNTSTQDALEQYHIALEEWDGTSAEATANLKSLYDNFYSLALSDSAYNDIQDELQSYSEALNFASAISSIEQLSYDSVVAEYLSSGYDDTLEHIQLIYNNPSASPEVREYIDPMLDYYTTLLEALELYSDQGCFIDGTVELTCGLDAESADSDFFQARKDTYLAMKSANSSLQQTYSLIKDSYNKIIEGTTQNAQN